MALLLSNSINYAKAFTRLRPLAGVGGADGEPAISIGNVVRGFMTAAPFAWNWNRATVSVDTIAGQQDYPLAASDFGWIEKATISNTDNTWEVDVKEVLANSSQASRPTSISAQINDGAGNVTFRLFNVPDGVYTLDVIYQKRAVTFVSVSDPWAPVPDELAYIFNTGVLAKAYEQADDSRFMVAWQLFIKQLIAANEGNKDANKSLFLEAHIAEERQRQSALIGAQQGRQARGL